MKGQSIKAVLDSLTIIHLQPIVIKEEKLSVELINDCIISDEANKMRIVVFSGSLPIK